jgi:hypothetical protein
MINKNYYENIKSLINKIDLKKFNIKLIKSNCNKIIIIQNQLKKIWDKIDENKIIYNIENKNDLNFNKIKKILESNFLSENIIIKNIIKNSDYIHHLIYDNIDFYWLSNIDNKNFNNNEYLIGLQMLKITLCLNQYKFNKNDNIKRCIIWIPIKKERNYNYKIINESNLKKSNDEYEAFVASGVTYGLNPRITIITRYEEVEKLLIHELIHNFNIDGSFYHNELKNILNKYKQIKNIDNYHYEYSIYESYTELLSTYFYLMFVNIKSNIDLLELKNKLLGQILIEILYSYNLIGNLIKLNNYKNYNDFKNKKIFKGNICKYEYYYLKALMYNNFILILGNELNDFNNIYSNILLMIQKLNIKDDELMKDIYNNNIKYENFKYQLH